VIRNLKPLPGIVLAAGDYNRLRTLLDLFVLVKSFLFGLPFVHWVTLNLPFLSKDFAQILACRSI